MQLDLSKIRVLIVDDSTFMRRLLRSLLNGLGIRSIIEAEDGVAGLAAFEENEIDIIITDWVMPVYDGLALTQAVRNPNSKNPFTPIIILSAYSEMSRVILARDAGVNGFLTKPISAKKLRMRLESCILNPRSVVPADQGAGEDEEEPAGFHDDATVDDDLTLGIF